MSPSSCLCCATGRSCDRHGLETQASAVEAAIGPGRLPVPRPSAIGGEPLHAEVRALLEPATGADLGAARVHAGPRADAAARAIGASAFTRGTEIFLGERVEAGDLGVLAHEATHVAQAARGPVPAVLARIDPVALDVTPELADSLTDEDLALAIGDARAFLDTTVTGGPIYDATLANLSVLEAEQSDRPLAGGPIGLIALGPPAPEEEAAQMSFPAGETGAPVCEAPDLAAPEAVGPMVEGPQCYGPIVGTGLTRDDILTDYKAKARQILTFFLEASRVWADQVVRAQLSTEEGQVSEEAVADLRTQAERANDLGRVAFDKRHIVIAIDYLTEHYVPPEGTPVPAVAGFTTLGSSRYIRGTFTRANLDRMGYPAEIPDIVDELRTLGFRPAVTDAEIEDHILEHATEDELWEAGMDHLIETGAVEWSPYTEPEYEWRDRVYTDEEVIALGTGYIIDDDSQRHEAEMLLDLLHAGEEMDPDVADVLDMEATEPAFNYVALRFVIGRIRAAAQTEYALAQQALETHFSTYPILRMFVDNESVLLNYLSTETRFHGIAYRPLVEVSAITTSSVMPKLEDLLTEIWELEQKIATDDDFLFDTAIAGSVAPLIQLYREADPQYGTWIDDEFESNRKWEEAISGLLTLAALLGFAIGSALTGGAAIPFLLAGLIASIGLAVRSAARSDVATAAAHTGIGSREAAAVAQYQAWLDTAMAALGVLQVLARGMGAAARAIAASLEAEEAQLASTIRVSRVFQAGNLTTAELAQIQAWQEELERILQQAVQIVDSGQGQTRWSQFMRSGHPRASLAVTRGNAVHAEAFELLQNSRGSTLPADMAWNRGVALPELSMPNRFPGRLPTSRMPMRPDVRIALPGGREAIFDFTTMGNLGHSAAYGNNSWVATVIELGY